MLWNIKKLCYTMNHILYDVIHQEIKLMTSSLKYLISSLIYWSTKSSILKKRLMNIYVSVESVTKSTDGAQLFKNIKASTATTTRLKREISYHYLEIPRTLWSWVVNRKKKKKDWQVRRWDGRFRCHQIKIRYCRRQIITRYLRRAIFLTSIVENLILRSRSDPGARVEIFSRIIEFSFHLLPTVSTSHVLHV